MAKDFTTTPGVVLGLRNNNPGNLRDDGTNWQGKIGSNQGFVVFKNLDYGIRAYGKDITSKMNRGLNTIAKIIAVYAPPSENNTQAYINRVSSVSGIDPNEAMKPNGDTLLRLAKAQFAVELGGQSSYITDSDIQNGLKLITGLTFGDIIPVAIFIVAGYLIFLNSKQ